MAAGSRFYLVGNHLAVDFANTVAAADGNGDALRSWADVVDFLVASGQLAVARAEAIRGLADTEPAVTARAFLAAVELRDGLRRAVAALAEQRAVELEWVEAINGALEITEGHDALVPASDGWRLGFVPREQRLEWLLAAVARSAAELVEQGPGAPLRKCAGARCVLYFYDTSRTRRRRWCSMAACGNRSKVAAFAGRRRRAPRGSRGRRG